MAKFMSESGEAYPTISVDRMAGLYFDDVGLDTGAIKDFYDGIPSDDKRSLDECHIHISGLSYIEPTGALAGAMYIDKARNKLHDPQTPEEADIVLFLGTILSSERDPHQVLGHELTHYAKNDKGQIVSIERRALELEHAILTSRGVKLAGFMLKNFVLGAAVYGVDKLSGIHPDPELLAGQLIAVNLLAKFINKIRNKRSTKEERVDEIQRGLMRDYKTKPEEQFAYEYGSEIEASALALTPKSPPREVLARRRRSGNRIIDHVHRQASLGRIKELPIKSS